jgi:phage-related protein
MMVSNISSVTSYMPSSTALKPVQSNYDTLSQAADSVGTSIADDVSNGASAVVSFSAESLSKLSQLATEGYNAVSGAIGDMGTAISDTATSAQNGLSSLYTDVSDMVSKGETAISDAASSAADTVSSAASSVADSIGSAANSVAGYATTGAVALKQTISGTA